MNTSRKPKGGAWALDEAFLQQCGKAVDAKAAKCGRGFEGHHEQVRSSRPFSSASGPAGGDRTDSEGLPRHQPRGRGGKADVALQVPGEGEEMIR